MLRHRRGLSVLVGLVAVLSLVAAGCGDDSSDEGQPTETTTVEVPSGGTLTLAAEQEPDCTDWIATCSGSSWGFWMMNVTTMPRVFNVTWDPDKEEAAYEATDIVTEEPTLETDPQKVTYKLNPKAVWSDGTPITSKDFRYTWEQIAGPNATDIYDATGYDKIESVDDSDPQTVVVTFKENYAGWKGLFGGGYGILPAHLLEGKDRAAEMANGYSWSAGPWTFQWEKGVSVTLTPNDKYWGPKPKLDKVVFKIVADTAAEFQAVKGGEVQGAYPQPQLDVIQQIGSGIPGFKSTVNAATGNIEALWINNAKAPFDSEAVRQAVAYSLDRDAIVKRLFGGLGVEKAAQSLEPGIITETDQQAFSEYTKNLTKVDELMTGDGWAKGSDGIWAKDGQKAEFTINSTAGNQRRELTQQILQEQLKEAGFSLKIDNKKAGDLFGQILPAGDYQMGLYAQVLTIPEPGACTLFCAKNNPDKNNGVGQNWQRVELPEEQNRNLELLDTELDPAARKKAGEQAMRDLAAAAVSIPLDPLPNILLTADSVVGPIGDNPVMGPFWNIHLWGIKK